MLRLRFDQHGVVLLTTMSALLVLSALAAAVMLSSSTEARIAAAFRAGVEGRHAADAAAERTLVDLAGTADWSAALSGLARSSFTDGPPSGTRTLPGGGRVDLDAVRNLANCGHAGPCSDAELDAVTAARPWGSNNPRWQIFAYGPLAEMSAQSRFRSRFYVVVLIGDDPGEVDGNPAQDALDEADRGHGIVLVRAEAFGPGSARRAVELTVAKALAGTPGARGVRVLTWKGVE